MNQPDSICEDYWLCSSNQESMEKRILQEINEIRKRMQCSKGFLCAESGYAQLCKAKDIGLKRHLLCQEHDQTSCDFSLLFDQKYYCGCPLRVYLKKKLQKKKFSKAEAV
jgi:hypothetical protein